MLKVWLNQLTSQPRSSSFLGTKGKPNPIVHVLQQTMQRYLTDVKITHLTADKRDPEFVFYDQTKTIMTAYRYASVCSDFNVAIQFRYSFHCSNCTIDVHFEENSLFIVSSIGKLFVQLFVLFFSSSSVKPAIFDLILSGAIAAYIAAVYFGVQVLG